MDLPDPPNVHVGLDALAAGPRPVGVARYVQGLIRGFEEEGLSRGVTVIARSDAGLETGSVTRAEPGLVGRLRPARLLWEQAGLPRFARSRGMQLVHGAMATVPLAGSLPSVVTIHDMTFHLTPQYHSRIKVAYFRWMTAASARKARLVIASSASTRDDLLRLIDVSPDKVRVVPIAVLPHFRQADDDRPVVEALGRYGLRRPYVLAVGVIEPRKNLIRLLEAVAAVRGRHRELELVIAGKPGWGWDAFKAALDSHRGLAGAVRVTGYFPDEDLPRLMAGAEALVYPSLYEGFGLPVAEALACGTPVVTASVSSLPEVGGDAAVYVDPLRTDAIADGIERVLTDSVLRGELVAKGLERARLFRPGPVARQVRAVYLEALGLSPRPGSLI